MPSDVEIAALLAKKGQPGPFLRGLAELYRERVGWKMLTLMTFDVTRGMARRIFTTDEKNYPTSAEKPMADSDWGEMVLKRGEIFVANRYEEFKPHYVDWEKLRGLGLESAVNFPAIVDGETLGTVNLTAGPGFYTKDRIEAGRGLAPLAVLGFLLISRTAAGAAR